MPLDPKGMSIIQNLLTELASELDLHYDPKDYGSLGPTVVHIVNAILYLKDNHWPVPDEVEDIITRFKSARN